MRGVFAGILIAGVAAGCASARPVAVAAPSVVEAKAKAPADESFSSAELGFELDKPQGEEWALATNVKAPDGNAIPVVVAHPQSGAQIVVQVSEPIDKPEALANMLRSRLVDQTPIELGEAERIRMDAGTDAFGFGFSVKGEAKGRVAVISLGEQIVLVVASWPEDADRSIVKAIDGVVKSVRLPAGASPAALRPDKA